jgi:hypothetical protein
MEILKVKYSYAGGSARFMFMFSIEELKTELELHLNNDGQNVAACCNKKESQAGRRFNN